MQSISSLLAELFLLSLEVFIGEASPGRVLTGLTLFQLASTGVTSAHIISAFSARSLSLQLLSILSLWSLSCLSILLWVLGRVILHKYGVR